MSDWDYIIVGAGSAGCSLAHQLVKSGGGQRVLVLEAGGSDRSLFIKFPAGVLRACEKFDWGYQAQPDPSRNGAQEKWLRGKVLGGSSSINGTIFVRGAAQDFDRWAEQCGNAGGWSAREVMPIFRELETSDQTGSLRGKDGPLYVRTVQRPHSISTAFLDSACASGYPFNPDYNGSSQEGFGYIQFTQRRGLRWSAADAFLKPQLGRRNLSLRLNTLVHRIEVIKGRANAVVFSHRGQPRRETARDVILCAGAINSPKLLMLSGIGDAQELRRLDIDVALDLPAVGRHLQDHPLLRLAYRSKIPTYNETEGWRQKLAFAMKFVRCGEGPLSNLFESTGFIRSSDSQPAPDLQLFFAALGSLRMPDGKPALAPYPSVAVLIAHSYPLGSGRIRLASARPDEPPLIEYALLENPADVEALIRGIQAVRRIMKTEPIANLLGDEVSPGIALQGATGLDAYVRDNTGICKHSIGTCRMGLGEEAVVGPDLRVQGTENLWIADASIMPSPISANINAACMMIGAKLGKELIARHGR